MKICLHKTFADGLINSIANEQNRIAPINMYNGIDYELQNRTI